MSIYNPIKQELNSHQEWWASLKHGGLLIAPSKLSEFFVAESLSPLPRFIEDRLRRDVTRLQNGEEDHLSTFLDTVLEEVLGLTGDWQKGSQVDRTWSYPAITREVIRPRRVWMGAHGEVLPVFVADGQEAGGKVTRLGIGRGKRAVSRVVEWLRKANQKIALLTNGYQWRLIHAGADYDAWCEWDVTFWFEEGQPSSQVTALRLLLGQQALQTDSPSGTLRERTDVPSPLLAAIATSRQGQAELSEVLGERVRQAVELLIRESAESLAELISPHPLTPSPLVGEGEPETGSTPLARSGRGAGGEGIEPRHVYIAATRIIMRCVVILFAEARDLLPRDNPIYHSAYGLQGLREQLDRRAGGRAAERLRQGVSSWSRLLALFKLVYEGCAHEALPVPQYGGGLFEPGNPAANDPILRALSAFENPSHTPSDAVVYRILELLCRSKVKVRQGRRSTWVEAPVDFSDLSSEYIGILYEGLLDFELRQATADEPMVFLNLGDQPVLPLARLEGMDDKTLAALVEKLKQKAKAEVEGEGEEGEDAESDEAEPEESEELDAEADTEPEAELDVAIALRATVSFAEDADQLQQLRNRAQQWAIRAVKAGNLVPKPRSKKADAQAAYEQVVGKAASALIARVVLPGEWFLVRWGGTRKGSGTFYTRPQLAIPTVQRTLLPLAYNPPHPPTPSPTREEGEPEQWEVPEELRQKMLEVARQFRKEPTSSEAVLWEALRGRKLEGRKFRRQQPIGSFVVDFFCPDERLIIEVDGGVHESQRELDEQRQNLLESLGLRFVRIQAEQVETDLETALNTIRAAFSPLSLDGRGAGGEGDKADWIPKTPIEILNLKICDPACGSASFLLAALRFLLEALWRSLFYHGWLVERGEEIVVSIPLDAQLEWFAECVKELPVTVEKAEERSKPRLKRFIVERCLYGVDINPLAVELARLALWVETMDKYLPFGFLDHKIKCGNALVGCWFDRFQDYPVMAWEREGGDANHDRFVHHFREYVATRGKSKGQHLQSGDSWTQAIKDTKETVKAELVNLIKAFDPEWRQQQQLPAPDFDLPKPPEEIHQDAVNIFEELHQLAIADTQEQERRYREKIEQSQELRQLRQAFDSWCAIWFWSGDAIEYAPTPGKFFNQPPETTAIVNQLAQEYRFFHWELEFPDVFVGENSGFSGIVGNPPWEIQKPNSKEFFSNIDPLYRTYGKQEALEKQLEYFQKSPQVEQDWLAYCAKLKALSNWTKYVGYPFGINEAGEFHFSLSRGKENAILHQDWLAQQQKRAGYADPDHPFRYQGSADINTYKMFTELAHTLLKTGGRFSLIIPSGIYTDKGTGQLRKLFLNHCEWTHLYAFQNERFVFGNIHHSFKMAVLTIHKTGQTGTIATRFRLGPGDSPEAQELETDILNDSAYLSVPAQQIKRFSPNTGALLEIRTEQDLKILEKMYQNGVLLGDRTPQGWGIQYAREFDMTNDSKLFSPRPKWEEKGYRPDEYGHWLKGNWQPYNGEIPILKRPEGLILSVDGKWAIKLADVEDAALPLYQGVMVQQFDFSPKEWISGTGLRAIWKEIPWDIKKISPQFLMSAQNAFQREKIIRGVKPSLRRVARNSDTRTAICCLVADMPCGDKASILSPFKFIDTLALPAYVNSYAFDWSIRIRVGGTQLDYHVISEMPTSSKEQENILEFLALNVLQLNGASHLFSDSWIALKSKADCLEHHLNQSWRSLWAISPYERLRLRCILDAIVTELYGLGYEDFAWILQDCDHPTAKVCDSIFARTLEPKGFWRVDKEKDPELRHTVLSLIAFYHLKQIGLEAFLNLNDGEGWMLPETLRLADYGLGHGDRAKEHQPVAARLGDRFLPWQLEGTPEESWEECERHAENLKRLLGDRPSIETASISDSPLFTDSKQLKLIEEEAQQLGLFD